MAVTVNVYGARGLDPKDFYVKVILGGHTFTTATISSAQPSWDEIFNCGPYTKGTLQVELYMVIAYAPVDRLVGRVTMTLADAQRGRHYRNWRPLKAKTRGIKVGGELELGVHVEEQTGTRKDRGTSKKELLLDEILDSEQVYLRHLDLLSTMQASLRGSNIMTAAEIRSIFKNADNLRSTNRMFRDMLVEADKTQTDRTGAFCQAYLDIAPFLRMYADYMASFMEAQTALAAMRKARPALQEFFKSIKPQDFGLADLDPSGSLSTPVQRICKYPLLFREVLKNAGADHPDIELIKATLHRADEVAKEVNEKTRSSEAQAATVQVEQSLVNCSILQPGRVLLMQGDAAYKHPVSGVLAIHYFVFHDLFLATIADDEDGDAAAHYRMIWRADVPPFTVADGEGLLEFTGNGKDYLVTMGPDASAAVASALTKPAGEGDEGEYDGGEGGDDQLDETPRRAPPALHRRPPPPKPAAASKPTPPAKPPKPAPAPLNTSTPKEEQEAAMFIQASIRTKLAIEQDQASGVCPDGEAVFEEHLFKKGQCKHCFQLRSAHSS